MNKKELNEAMVSIKPSHAVKKVGQTIRYNPNGQSDFAFDIKFDDTETAAVELVGTTGTLYRVKAERGGKLYNPLKQANAYNLSIQDRTTKDLRFQLKAVSEKAFKHYVRYLAERHESLLLAAEREV
jgi:hypothetical protein